MFDESLYLIESGIGTAFPCAAVAVGAGHKVFARSFFGHRQVLPSVLELIQDTLFDLASLSKLVATTTVALKFIESGRLSLNDNIGKFLGYTGTSFYVDSETGLWGVLLTNAVHYGRENRSKYFSLKRSFYDMIITEYKNLQRKDEI